MMIRNYFVSILVCVTVFSLFTTRTDGATFRVVVFNDGEEVAEGLGIWVAEGVLLTASAIVEQGDQIFIENPDTGIRVLATLQSSFASMALVSVDGLSIDSIVAVASQPPHPNTAIHFSFPDGIQRKGLLSFAVTPDSLIEYQYKFTMAVDPGEIGVPVMNRCEELISVASIWKDDDEMMVGVSESYEAMISFLRAENIAFSTATDPCPTLEDQLSQAQGESLTLQENIDSLKNELQSLEDESAESQNQSAEQIARLNRQKSILESQITETEAKQDSVLQESQRLLTERDSLIERYDLTREALDSLKAEHNLFLDSLETLESQIDSLDAQRTQDQERQLMIGGIAALLILIAVALLFLFWKRRREAEEELSDKEIKLQEAEEVIQQKSATFPDLLLAGVGPNNEEIRVKVSGEVLAQTSNGILLGRSSAQANCVIVENSVSRQHARLTLVNDTVMICDLESLNGTVVNGVKLVPGKNHPLPQGARIILGDVQLTMTILQ